MSKIKILGYTHDLTIDPRLGSAGRSALDWQILQIDAGLCEEQKDSTLIHEVIEQINKHLNLGLDEQQICGIEVGIFSFLTENDTNYKFRPWE